MLHYHGVMSELLAHSGLSLERLRAFLAIADAGGISRASRGSATRQSQLSRQLGELEAFFGRPLMERRGGRRVLNEHGRRLAEHIRWTFAGLVDLQAGQAAESTPTFVLAAGDAVLHWLVLPRIAEVGAAFEIVALPAEDVVARLLDGSADFGIVRADDVRKELSRHLIGSVEHALFVPRALGRGVADDELLFKVPVALQIADTDFLARLNEHAGKRGKTLKIALRCESFPQVLRAVQSGAFAGLLPTWAAGELPVSRFRSVTVAGRHASRLHLAWSPRLLQVRAGAERVLERLSAALKRAE